MRDHGEAAQAEQVGAAVGVRVEPRAQPRAPPAGSAGRRACRAASRRSPSRSASSTRLDRPLEQLQRHVAGEAVADDDVGGAGAAGRGSRRCRRSRARSSASSACASSVSWLPFSGSSPIESRRTSGCAMLEDLLRRRSRPCSANWSRCSGRASAFAPASSSTDGPRCVGIGTAIAGRMHAGHPAQVEQARRRASRPCSRPRRPRRRGPRRRRGSAATSERVAASRARPRPASRASRSRSVASTSSSPPRVEAGRAEEHGVDPVGGGLERARDDLVRARGRRPSRRPRRGPSGYGARRAERLDLAALVRLARRADAVRPLRLMAGRADVDARRLDAVLRAALVAAGLRGFLLGDCHERLPSIATGDIDLVGATALEEAPVVRDDDEPCPRTPASAVSSSSIASRSRWFVGSSRTRQLTPRACSSARCARVRSPGESVAQAGARARRRG